MSKTIKNKSEEGVKKNIKSLFFSLDNYNVLKKIICENIMKNFDIDIQSRYDKNILEDMKHIYNNKPKKSRKQDDNDYIQTLNKNTLNISLIKISENVADTYKISSRPKATVNSSKKEVVSKFDEITKNRNQHQNKEVNKIDFTIKDNDKSEDTIDKFNQMKMERDTKQIGPEPPKENFKFDNQLLSSVDNDITPEPISTIPTKMPQIEENIQPTLDEELNKIEIVIEEPISFNEDNTTLEEQFSTENNNLSFTDQNMFKELKNKIPNDMNIEYDNKVNEFRKSYEPNIELESNIKPNIEQNKNLIGPIPESISHIPTSDKDIKDIKNILISQEKFLINQEKILINQEKFFENLNSNLINLSSNLNSNLNSNLTNLSSNLISKIENIKIEEKLYHYLDKIDNNNNLISKRVAELEETFRTSSHYLVNQITEQINNKNNGKEIHLSSEMRLDYNNSSLSYFTIKIENSLNWLNLSYMAIPNISYNNLPAYILINITTDYNKYTVRASIDKMSNNYTYLKMENSINIKIKNPILFELTDTLGNRLDLNNDILVIKSCVPDKSNNQNLTRFSVNRPHKLLENDNIKFFGFECDNEFIMKELSKVYNINISDETNIFINMNLKDIIFNKLGKIIIPKYQILFGINLL